MPYNVLFIAVDSEALGGAELGQAFVADMDIEGANRPPTAREGATSSRRLARRWTSGT